MLDFDTLDAAILELEGVNLSTRVGIKIAETSNDAPGPPAVVGIGPLIK